LFLTAEVCECLSLRISDIIEYSPTKDAFIQAIGVHNASVLEELKELHLYDFGIFIDLQPDEEERMMLENNIQMALQQQVIELADAIDVRDIKNIKLANQLLKLRRKKKLDRDQAMQEKNMQMQSQMNQQAAQVAAQSEVQKNQALTASQGELEQLKAQLASQRMMQEVQHKKELMQLEFQMNMQLKGMEVNGKKQVKKKKKIVKTKEQRFKQLNKAS
jgi:hypothetical protein